MERGAWNTENTPLFTYIYVEKPTSIRISEQDHKKRKFGKVIDSE